MLSPAEKFQHVSKNSSEENGLHAAEQLGGFDFNFGAGMGQSRAEDNSAGLELAIHEHQVHQQFQQFTEFGSSSCDSSLGVVCPPADEILKIGAIEPLDAGPIQHEEKTTHASPSSPFYILRKHQADPLKFKSSSAGGSHKHPTSDSSEALSTEAILELASENYIQFTSNEFSMMLDHSYPGSLFGRSGEELKGVKLIQDLLCCAKRVSDKQYECAIKLLHDCHTSSSPKGTPVQRLVFYFAEALQQRIGTITGRVALSDSSNKNADPLEAFKWPSSIALTMHRAHPLSQIPQFSAAQAVLDHIGEAGKVHIVDFEIRAGLHSVILMQGLVAQRETRIQHLRITAVGTKSKSIIEETGRRLMSFAQSLNLGFTFNIIMVKDMLDLNENLFKLDGDEAVAIYAMYTLTALVARGDQLKKMLQVIKYMNPRLMMVAEIEANCISPTFVGRFVEALFYFAAFFDSLADCMKDNENIRAEFESACLSWGIRNILAAEGTEREIVHAGINVWRKYLEHCGLVEIELSKLSLCHANLVLQKFACQSSCTLAMDGKCLTVGWKGTPLSTLSAWKFQ